jgi:hypothetical protein
VLDLIEQDFQDISNVTGRIFEIGVQRFSGSVSTGVCPNSEFLTLKPSCVHFSGHTEVLCHLARVP